VRFFPVSLFSIKIKKSFHLYLSILLKLKTEVEKEVIIPGTKPAMASRVWHLESSHFLINTVWHLALTHGSL